MKIILTRIFGNESSRWVLWQRHCVWICVKIISDMAIKSDRIHNIFSGNLLVKPLISKSILRKSFNQTTNLKIYSQEIISICWSNYQSQNLFSGNLLVKHPISKFILRKSYLSVGPTTNLKIYSQDIYWSNHQSQNLFSGNHIYLLVKLPISKFILRKWYLSVGQTTNIKIHSQEIISI